MKKMKKKTKKAESDAVRDKQQQQRERAADDVVDRHTNQFPNFMALTEDEKLVFFESLHAARKSVLDSGNKVAERFGTVHDEYLKYFGSVEDNEGSDSSKDSSQTLERSGMDDSVSSSLRSESYSSTQSTISRRTMTKPVETICIHMNINSSTPSIESSKISFESKSLTSKEDEEREKEDGSGRKSTETNQIQTKSPKRKRMRDKDDSDKVKMESSSRCETKLSKLKKRESRKAQKDERDSSTSTSTSNKPLLEALESEEKEIFFSAMKEARDIILTESPDKDNKIMSVENIMKEYEKPEEATPMKMKVPCINANNLKVKLIITSSESKRLKKERVSKRKERCRKTEKEKTKKTTGGSMEKDKKSKTTERKLGRSTDGVRKKQQRQNNPIAMTVKSKENKWENVKAQKKRDLMKGSEKGCQSKRNKEEGKVLVKRERSTIKNLGGKQEKKKILASRKKIQKDKPKEKREKPTKKGSPKSEQVKQDTQFVLLKEEKQEVVEQIKEDSRSSGDCVPRALKDPTETVKAEVESIETFFFVNAFKYIDEVEVEERDKTEDNPPEDSLSLKSFQNEFGEEVKCLEVESVEDKSAKLSMDTTDEEITIEVEEEIPVTETPLPVTSEVRYQPEQTEAERHIEKSKSSILEQKPEGEALDECHAGEASSPLMTSDNDSVLRLWEQLKRLQLSDSNCVMETKSLTAKMESEDISESRFTFLSDKISPDKVHLAEEKLIVVGSENKIEEGERGRRGAAVLDLLKSEGVGVIVVNADAIEKLKNLVEALEKEAETEGDTKLNVKPEKNFENDYSQLLIAYIDYLTRLVSMLTNKRDQKLKTRVRASLTASGSHPEFVENKNKELEFTVTPRAVSDTNLLEDRKTEVDLKAKESILQGSEVEANPSPSLSISDSPTTESSCEDDVPLVMTPSTRKKLIEVFVRERAKFVEESIDGFRIVKMASGVQDQETGQNGTKVKFFHIFSRLFKCVKKKGSEEDQVRRRQQRTGGKENH